MRHYVEWSSWFDRNVYNKRKISNVIKRAGGKNIQYDNAYGWSNQPEVVIFETTAGNVENIKKAVEKALSTQWILISRVGWKIKK